MHGSCVAKVLYRTKKLDEDLPGFIEIEFDRLAADGMRGIRRGREDSMLLGGGCFF
jgi:hypothetical protein